MQPPLLVGISGPSCSGKTTLARLLRDLFPPTQLFLLHLDDFYRTDADIPVKDGVRDWVCLEAIDQPRLEEALREIKRQGTVPSWLLSKEDQNSLGEHGVAAGEIQRLRAHVDACLQASPGWQDRRICIVDGFLLFSRDMEQIWSLFDLKLFLCTGHETAKRRREARSGYVTLEGFWQDPPGYVDKVVWPNYVRHHKFLFQDGDVEGRLDPDVCNQIGIQGMPHTAQGNMLKCLAWAAEVVTHAIENS